MYAVLPRRGPRSHHHLDGRPGRGLVRRARARAVRHVRAAPRGGHGAAAALVPLRSVEAVDGPPVALLVLRVDILLADVVSGAAADCMRRAQAKEAVELRIWELVVVLEAVDGDAEERASLLGLLVRVPEVVGVRLSRHGIPTELAEEPWLWQETLVLSADLLFHKAPWGCGVGAVHPPLLESILELLLAGPGRVVRDVRFRDACDHVLETVDADALLDLAVNGVLRVEGPSDGEVWAALDASLLLRLQHAVKRRKRCAHAAHGLSLRILSAGGRWQAAKVEAVGGVLKDHHGDGGVPLPVLRVARGEGVLSRGPPRLVAVEVWTDHLRVEAGHHVDAQVSRMVEEGAMIVLRL
mmetsp:Transcript_98529/g.306801  ORF Transcript_98529/g.306801 Transcript_98529/m.306801 type:complete len:354 (+) Transcript_98529:503-1564(+)